MGIFINTTGEHYRITPANGKHFSLRELQGFIGGYIERIEMNNGCAMYVDEDGRLKRLQRNEEATKALLKSGILVSDYIRGNAVILQYREEK